MQSLIIPVLFFILCALPATAMEAPTLALGEKLFKATTLGTNSQSCATCHPKGKGLEEIGAYNDEMLKEMVNFCIRDALKGKMIDLESTEINSFLLYLRSLN